MAGSDWEKGSEKERWWCGSSVEGRCGDDNRMDREEEEERWRGGESSSQCLEPLCVGVEGVEETRVLRVTETTRVHSNTRPTGFDEDGSLAPFQSKGRSETRGVMEVESAMSDV